MINKNNIYFTITKVKSKDYNYYRIQKQVNGKKINVTGKTKQEVTEKFYDKLEELKNLDKHSVDVYKMTFEEFVHYYLLEVVEPSKSVKDSSLRQYNSTYNKHIKNSSLASIKLTEIKKEHLQKYFNNKLKENLSVTTIKFLKVFISAILNYAEEEEYILKNYCKSVKLPANNKAEKHKFLTDDEIKSILNNCKDSQLLLIIKIALTTGMRINEILALTPNDFNFEDNSLKVIKTLSYSNRTMSITPPKSNTSIRTIFFNSDLTSSIKKYILSEKERYLKFGKIFNNDSFIFTTKRFTLVNHTGNVMRKMNALYKKCNIDATGFHILRHTYGSKLYENGVDIKTISELLGHSNINTTNSIYLHLKDEHKKKAVEYLCNIIN